MTRAECLVFGPTDAILQGMARFVFFVLQFI